MITQNKLKTGIAVTGVLLVLAYVCFLGLYGGEYLNLNEYILKAGLATAFVVPVIPILKFLYGKYKKSAVLLTAVIAVVAIFVIPCITGETLKANTEVVLISMWPLLCYYLTRYLKIGEMFGKRPFICNFVIYNILVVTVIWLLQEVLFKYSYISADIIGEGYLYVISIIAFLIYSVKSGRAVLDKWDILGVAVVICGVVTLWVCTQERIAMIIESLGYSGTEIDGYGEFFNWISHRLHMLQTSVSGDFSGINTYRIQPLVQGCSVAWLSGKGGFYIPVVLFAIGIIMIALLFIYSRKNANIMVKIILISFGLKFIIGIFTNFFLIFSTSVGLPVIGNVYDIAVLILLLFFFNNPEIETRKIKMILR